MLHGTAYLLDRVRGRAVSIPEGPPVYRNLIHRDDVIGILNHLITLPNPDPVYNGVDSEPVDVADLVRWVSGRLGMDNTEGEQENADLSKRTITNKRCKNDKILKSGYSFRYPTYREGYDDIIANIG